MKSIYVRLVRACANLLGRSGVLSRMERASAGRPFRVWFVSLFAIYDVQAMIRLDVPWWTFRSSQMIDAFLAQRPRARVFEWGSGASTVWLSKRAAHVTSVEHDEAWLRVLQPILPTNVSLVFVPAPPVAAPGEGMRSGRRGAENLDFTRYVTAIESAVGPFDLVVVDGRARVDCLRAAREHLAPGGIIVFDNANRRRYRRAFDERSHSHGLHTSMTRGLTPGLPYPTSTALLRQLHE